MSSGRERVEPALRPVGGVEEIQVVGALHQLVVAHLGLRTSARSVWLHQNTVAHIQSQRGVGAKGADLVLSAIPRAVIQPDLAGPSPSDHRRYCLVHMVEGSELCVVVGIKCVSAAEAESLTDEIWISTGYPIRTETLTRRRWRDTLAAIPWGADD